MKNSYEVKFTHNEMIGLILIMDLIKEKNYEGLKKVEGEPLVKEAIEVIQNVQIHFEQFGDKFEI
jgi:hypothetical protein